MLMIAVSRLLTSCRIWICLVGAFDVFGKYTSIEGLHETVRTKAHKMLQHLLVFFCMAWYGEKQQKKRLNFRFASRKGCNFHQVCVLIFLPLDCNLVMWYELNKKLWNMLLLFQ